MPRPSRPALALLSVLSALAAAPLHAQEATPPPAPTNRAVRPEETVGPVTLRNEGRDQVLDLYERWTGKTLLRPQSLPEASITLSLNNPLPKSEALRALETLLNMQGIGFSPLGDRFIKVTALNLIRTEAPDFIEGSTLDMAPTGHVATKLFTLNFLRVGEFVPQIQQLLSPNIGAAPALFEKANAVLIVETISNLQRIEMLVNQLDRPIAASTAVKAYTIINAKASDVANKLRTFLGGPLATQIATTTTYQADDRTNQIILISDVREQPLFDELITKLDTEASPNTRSEVIFLKHANAPDVEALLAKLVTGQSTAAQRDAGASGRLSNTRLNPTPVNPAPTPGAPAAPAVAAANATVNETVASEEFSSLLTIVSDERSNAIVVAGTPNDIKLVSSLVNRLDVILAQVRIEVVIVDVTVSDDTATGISSLGLTVTGDKVTGFSGAIRGAGDGAPTSLGVTNGTVTRPGITGDKDLAATLALSSTPRKNNATILSVPTIVTTHNREAEIFVGQSRPIISGTTSGASGSSSGLTTSSTITQQEIGTRLRILPLIGSNGDVQLEVEQEVENIIGSVDIDENSQPIIGRRTTTSYVSARNGDIIVLGGLQSSEKTRSTSRLGPIPILGDLLGARSRSKGRSELLFFLRPIVLTNSNKDNVEAIQRLNSMKEGQEALNTLFQTPAAVPVDQLDTTPTTSTTP